MPDLFEKFRAGLPYIDFIDRHANEAQKQRWQRETLQPALKKAKLEVLVEACGKRLCRREIIELRASRKKPHRRTQQLLESILKRLGFL